jgi:hypothetical protein
MNTKLKWSVVLVLCIVFATVILPRFFHNRDLPQKLQGVWQTGDTSYADHRFLLDKNAIGFGTGDGKTDWYRITRVDETLQRNTTLYAIEFQNDSGAVFKRLLYYYPDRGGRIRFKNQPNIEWTLVKS